MAEASEGASSVHLKVADLAVRLGRRVWRSLPARARKDLEDRAFFVIFQKTRVENDAYGWRPPEAGPPGTPGGTPRA